MGSGARRAGCRRAARRRTPRAGARTPVATAWPRHERPEHRLGDDPLGGGDAGRDAPRGGRTGAPAEVGRDRAGDARPYPCSASRSASSGSRSPGRTAMPPCPARRSPRRNTRSRVYEERPVAEKVAVPKERVRLDKDVVTDEEQVSGEVRKERIEVEGDVDRDIDRDRR